MKHNITLGIITISAIALSSCSTTKLASTQNSGDDVYNSQATAVEAPVYAPRPVYRDEYDNEESSDGYEDDYYTNDDDYHYYDDYASRINRFSYYSPFGYYDDLYYGYGPGLGMGFGYGGWGGGWGMNIGFGWGTGWGGWGFSPYWGSPWGYGGWGGLGYSYWGTGWGGYPYWGLYSGFGYAGTPRPVRGGGSMRNAMASGRNARGTTSYLPNRPNRINSTTRSATSGRPSRVDGRASGSEPRIGRPSRETSRPTYRPSVDRSPSTFGGGRSGGSFGGGGRSSGGGGRPVRQ
ncbi:hypothetical protein DJ568_03375 [Mucilaginibacter hurinus]|uniref:Prolyl-tRNA synthetase n=1 Tax=Mucilaginibacter hurinus TaxID=2201324 RepID=A0A367GRC4_9SPHI|nr:hypothetical protein [Mucilaginibacter hurinus]RCH55810.1 hypothetical protein DJ568_03375 [Mucilaginibacter hurinus]